jgi:hypothetical protein
LCWFVIPESENKLWNVLKFLQFAQSCWGVARQALYFLSHSPSPFYVGIFETVSWSICLGTQLSWYLDALVFFIYLLTLSPAVLKTILLRSDEIWGVQCFSVCLFFEIVSLKLFAWAGFEPLSSWSLPPESLGLQAWATGTWLKGYSLLSQ